MAVIEGGVSAALADVGAASASGMHVIAKPTAFGTLGHYAAVLTTGTMAAGMAGNGELVQMRWVDGSKMAVIQEIQVLEFRNITTAFVAGVFAFNVIRSTAWSADGTGGGAVAVTDPQMQLRVSMGNSLFSTGFRLATTAALGAGTKTFDTNPMGACFGNVGTTIAIAQYYIPGTGGSGATHAAGPGVTLWKTDLASGEHPIHLANNEGISIRATVPATGTWIATFLIKWAEVTAF
jgi:hypothetical protein